MGIGVSHSIIEERKFSYKQGKSFAKIWRQITKPRLVLGMLPWTWELFLSTTSYNGVPVAKRRVFGGKNIWGLSTEREQVKVYSLHPQGHSPVIPAMYLYRGQTPAQGRVRGPRAIGRAPVWAQECGGPCKCFAGGTAVGCGYVPMETQGTWPAFPMPCAPATECPEFAPSFGKTPHPTGPRPRLLTSSTLHAAPFPAAVGPDEQRVLGFFGFTLIFRSVVDRHGVLVMDSIILVMKQQHLDQQ